jgi:hypothetical protein
MLSRRGSVMFAHRREEGEVVLREEEVEGKGRCRSQNDLAVTARRGRRAEIWIISSAASELSP